MRRAILAATLGAALLTGTACDSDAEPTASGGSAAPSAPTPTVSIAAYAANTRKICDDVQKIFDTDITPFGTALGKMIAYKEEKLPKEADKYEKAARKQLKTVATKITNATQNAEDAAIVTAGKASAAKFTASAADDKLYDSIKSSQDLNRFIDGKLGEWLTPISGYCA
jgi:hypothetical protein